MIFALLCALVTMLTLAYFSRSRAFVECGLTGLLVHAATAEYAVRFFRRCDESNIGREFAVDKAIVETKRKLRCRMIGLSKKIIDALKKLPPITRNYNFSDGEWTIGIQAILARLSHEEKCKVAANKKNVGRGFEQIRNSLQEKPLSITNGCTISLVSSKADQSYMLDVPLVLESEWGDHVAYEYDFQKLLLARSKYKVMIFECGNHVIEWSKEQIRYFSGTKGDRYLFCSWQGSIKTNSILSHSLPHSS
ncbi:MAG: hypothetical protein IPH12_19175 [Saprospirales bacterium]|nr:hypothetical protein [Saprospirales bacterium]